MAKLYLHLGPPKTATTALQKSLLADSSSFVYLGKMHTRGQCPAVSTTLHDAVAGKDIDENKASEALRGIREVIDSGKHAVISEEMLLIDGEIAHQDKIRRLIRLLEDIPVVAIICLRDPVDALPSLYQERYRKLPFSEKQSFSSFLRGNQAQVFDYAQLSGLIADFDEIRTVRFEDLVGGSATLQDIFGEDFGNDASVRLDRTNVGAQGTAGRHIPPVRLRDVVKSTGAVPLSLKDKLRSIGFVRSIWRRISSFEFAGGTEKDLIVPEQLAGELRQKWICLRDKGG